MRKADAEVWGRAGNIAFMAMGKAARPSNQRRHDYDVATEDPLAWWCLTELIAELAFSQRRKR